MAPSTLGTCLRSFTFGHVRQLEAVVGKALDRAWTMGAGPSPERAGDRRRLHLCWGSASLVEPAEDWVMPPGRRSRPAAEKGLVLQETGVGGDVDGVLSEGVEGHDVEGALVGAGQDHERCRSVLVGP
jgi:hypothetical protein